LSPTSDSLTGEKRFNGGEQNAKVAKAIPAAQFQALRHRRVVA